MRSMMKTEIVTIKKLKKDGNIDRAISRKIADLLKRGNIVLMPVDAIYGLVSVMEPRAMAGISKVTSDKEDEFVRMISSFKMLNDIGDINKMEFDFLHRIWPGELIVYVRDIRNKSRSIPVRMPKSRYHQEIIEHVEQPLVYSSLHNTNRGIVYRKKDLISSLDEKIDFMLIIEEFCKEHTLPSVVDISRGDLVIVNEGRVSTEEIKSLYFLGKDDSAL
jgi:tRNA threonylcarbamoyl adenosine modification protein (Sua5/YciO/YrdC/YwlC family)